MKVHFIGVGGIGVSALAQYYLAKNHKISGSDLVSSETTKALKKIGAKIFIGKHKAKNLSKNTELIIYSPAVQPDNPELKKAYELQASGSNLQAMSYPEALGKLTKEYFTIAIAGTHGKSTTTAMIGLLLIKAGFDPTVIIGTKVKEFKDSNFRAGKSIRQAQGKIQYLVIEACEYEESFLNYFSDITVITNIEPDHLDYYKNFNNVKKAFAKFAKKLKKGGVLITERQYKNLKDAKKLEKILKVPGEHNISNALVALAVARTLKIPDKISFKALSEYRGSWRRFELTHTELRGIKRGTTRKIIIISDYAHHPTEVKATLEAACEKYFYPPKFSKEKFRRACPPKFCRAKFRRAIKKIWCIFQPHQYHRTHCLFNDFVKVFRAVPIDKIIITDIYDVAGREDEKIKKKINSQKIVKAINKPEVIYLPQQKIVSYLKENLQGEEIIIIMGAGDIYKLIEKI